jgi:glycosyltransferase involved in cell wall biosynthesis
MNVLIVHDYGTLSGGAENVSAMLRDGLRRRGHDARLLASTARPLPLPNVADYTCFGTMSSPRRVLQVANPAAVHRLRRVLREFRPDVVHLRMYNTQLSPLILQPLVRYPTLLHVGSYELICPLLTKTLPDGSPCHYKAGPACSRAGCVPLLGAARTVVQARLRRRWQDAVTLTVPNSDWLRRRLLADGVEAGEAVPNGVPVRSARPPLTDPPTVAFAGRLVPKKGLDVLLEAMALVVAELPEARLLIAGDGPERRRVDETVAASGLAANVVALGHRPRAELEPLLAGAWVQAVPSRWEEPFGNAAAEAMMRGTAVVASDTGGLRELVEDGGTGFLVPRGDAHALARALLRVLGDAELAERLGAAARAKALAELTEDRMLDRFLELYEQLLRQPVSVAAPAYAD